VKPRSPSLQRPATEGHEFRPGIPRPGFTAVEITVGVAIVASLAALSVPLAAFREERKVEAAGAMLAEIREGLTSPSAGFRNAVGANAGQLSELTAQIWNGGAGTPFPTNSCGKPFSSSEVNNWDDSGPYVGFFIPATGLETPIGVAADRLIRVAEGDSTTLRVVINDVDADHAKLLDRKVDGANGSDRGAVRWNTPKRGGVTLLFVVPIDARC
jgi:hypothetical protein